MKKSLFALLALIIMFSSCEWLEDNAPDGLSDEEIVEGLKTALSVGADTAATTLSIINGYYGNPLLKIPLPEEAELVRDFVTNNNVVKSFFDLDQEFENVILSINRAAEDAAKEAAPIFKNAIMNLSITQGLDILNGIVPGGTGTSSGNFDSTAATGYLKIQTFEPLQGLYAPKINTALGKDLGLGFSAVDAWGTLTTTYNSVLSRSDVQAAILAATAFGTTVDIPGEMNTDLGDFSTEKALTGLFYRVGQEEVNIRRNPLEWIATTVGAILEKVFGSNS